MFKQTLDNKTYLLISVGSSNRPQQRVLWHHWSHMESLNTSGCAFFQSSKEKFNHVIPVPVLSAMMNSTVINTNPATRTSLATLYLKWLTFHFLPQKQNYKWIIRPKQNNLKQHQQVKAETLLRRKIKTFCILIYVSRRKSEAGDQRKRVFKKPLISQCLKAFHPAASLTNTTP